MSSLVFIATHWGTNEGGINSFNYDFVKAIADSYKAKCKIVCVVKEAHNKDIESAKKLGIEVILIEGRFNSSVIFDEVKKNGHNQVICWIGHDIITGFKAIECVKLDKYLGNNSKSAVIHHMNYLKYYASKSGSGEEANQRDKLQKRVLEQADLVYAVGPYLVESAINKIRTKDNPNPEVYELIPGIADLESLEPHGDFSGIVYGRLGGGDEIVKQGKLAIASFFKACAEDKFNNSVLTVVGLDDKELIAKQKELQDLGFEHSNKLVSVLGLGYKDREELYDIVRVQDISMMLSTHEGFGLVGWEAISAEIPLILSVDTGLYKFLDNLGGSYTGCIYGVEITGDFNTNLEVVSSRIKEVKNDLTKSRRNAKNLKKQLEEFSWKKTAEDFFSNIDLESILDNYGDMNFKKSDKININNNQKDCLPITTPFLFSTSTHLSYLISKNYFNDTHYAWCAPKFDAKETNPASANPLEIYKKLTWEIGSGQEGATIAKHKVGLYRALSEKKQQGVISEQQELLISEIIHAAQIGDFRPVIYAISTYEVKAIVKAAPHNKKDGVFSQEFLIKELPGALIELINIDI
ncbi:glycosyltransferase [Lysinibacillus sp. NPDC093197]|uniref:glycosyltransferase n=1 Tax=Lysinibacillus sp. NPDC093197 TaxID=3364132 RepID=UPI003802315D